MISTASSATMDLYEVLGLKEKNCTESDVKKAYRKMALRWHPEKNPANHEEAVGRFEKISEAYQILSNSHSREKYDRYRSASEAAAAAAEEKASSVALSAPSRVDREELRDRLAFELRLIILKPAQQVFDDFFGGRNPFSDMFGCNADDLCQRSTANDKVFTLPAFSEESTNTKEHPDDSLNNSSASSAAATVTSSVRQVSTSTRLSNGKRIVTRKVIENGVETVTTEENGKLIAKTVNGIPVNTDADDKPTVNQESQETAIRPAETT